MRLVTAKVGPFRSINQMQAVDIDPDVTVLVGMNESGKTVFLKALERSQDALGAAEFDPVEDYPRKELAKYSKQHKTEPAIATELVYELTDDEVAGLNRSLGTQVRSGFSLAVLHDYANNHPIRIEVDERPVIEALAASTSLSSDARAGIQGAHSLREIPTTLKAMSLTDADKKILAKVEERIAAAPKPIGV